MAHIYLFGSVSLGNPDWYSSPGEKINLGPSKENVLIFLLLAVVGGGTEIWSPGYLSGYSQPTNVFSWAYKVYFFWISWQHLNRRRYHLKCDFLFLLNNWRSGNLRPIFLRGNNQLELNPQTGLVIALGIHKGFPRNINFQTLNFHMFSFLRLICLATCLPSEPSHLFSLSLSGPLYDHPCPTSQ